jgi:hypothetical protein
MTSLLNRSSQQIMLAVVILTCLAIPIFAQPARLRIEIFDSLAPRAAETVDVTLDKGLLKMAARFLNNSKPDEAKIREIIEGLEGVYVKSLQFDHEGEYNPAEIDSIRAQLQVPGWSKIATVRSRRDDNVDVHLMLENGVINGVAVLVAGQRQLTVVNIVGVIDPEKISQLGLLEGRLGIPRLDFDWAVTRKSNRTN